jgi:hypothetical protein
VRLGIAIGCVALVSAAACVSVGTAPSPSASGVATASVVAASPSPSPAVAPTSLHADQPRVWRADPRAWTVVLTWRPPAGFEADHYEIERNGRTLRTDLPGTRLVDQEVIPETEYRYGVTAVDVQGTRTAAATVTVETSAPRVADARLDGRFAMRMHITDQGGLQGGASGGGMLFRYEPVCENGPCDVVWSRVGSPGSGRLDRDDASYDGTVRAPFVIGSCRGGSVTETLVFGTRVVEASAVRGQWRATKITGTLEESASSSGCVTATIDWNFTGFVQT